MNEQFNKVDADTWADFCADYRTYASEQTGVDNVASTMILRNRGTLEIIGRVDYLVDGSRDYFIAVDPESQKVEYTIK